MRQLSWAQQHAGVARRTSQSAAWHSESRLACVRAWIHQATEPMLSTRLRKSNLALHNMLWPCWLEPWQRQHAVGSANTLSCRRLPMFQHAASRARPPPTRMPPSRPSPAGPGPMPGEAHPVHAGRAARRAPPGQGDPCARARARRPARRPARHPVTERCAVRVDEGLGHFA